MRPPPYPPDRPIDAAALPCLRCDYDLRSLPGDPIRCPECGHLNSLDEVRAVRLLGHAAFRQFETHPAMCVGAFWAVALGIIVFASGMEVCAVVLVVPALIVWATSFARFRELCQATEGWVGVMWWFHLTGAVLGIAIGAGSAAFVSGYTYLETRLHPVALLILALGTALGGGPLLKRGLQDVWNPYTVARLRLRKLFQSSVAARIKAERTPSDDGAERPLTSQDPQMP